MMNSNLNKTFSPRPAVPALATLAQPHGYRLDGDTAYLHARFTVTNPLAHQRTWALQLWACPSRPQTPRDLAGHVVAEVQLPPMREVADETEHFNVTAVSVPPAGPVDYWMVLVLASGKGGLFNEVHDLFVYPAREHFVQPRMRGQVGYRLNGQQVELTVESIENPRDCSNQSGTLALELWALTAPYSGGQFDGIPLAGVTIGTVAGQTQVPCRAEGLAYTAPPTGTWHFVLMLREWTPSGYVTRDYASFSEPVVVGVAKKAEPQAKAAPAIVNLPPAPSTDPKKASPVAEAPKPSPSAPPPTPPPSAKGGKSRSARRKK